jgi:hypothetical protein
MADNESLISCKLLAKEYFSKVKEAIETNNIDMFSNICKEAGIPEKTRKILKSTFKQMSINCWEGWPAWGGGT